MKRAFFTLVFCICFVQNSFGLPSLTCNDVHPISTSTVKCSCQNAGAPGINWYTGSVFLTQCTILSGQCFTSMGYTFTVDSTTSTYTIEFGSYSYTQCTNVTCSDSTTPSDSAFKHISVDAVSYSPTITAVNEPDSSHMNGNINFTTDCIYKTGSSYINATAIWKAVVNETEADELDINETISETGSCQFCSDDFASTFFVSFIHQEEQSDSRIKAKIRLLLYIDGITDPFRKTTENEYNVQGKNESSNTTTTITISTSTSDVIKNTTTNSDKNVRSVPTCYLWCTWFDKEYVCIIIIIIIIAASLVIVSYINAAVIYVNQQLSNILFQDLEYKKCRLLIPYFGLFLVIRHCIYCKLYKVKPETPKYPTNNKDSVKNNTFNMLGGPASNGKRETKCAEDSNIKSTSAEPLPVTTLDGMLTTCRRKHQRIAGEDEICCDNCKVTRKSHASQGHAYCLSDEEYICTSCLNKCHKQCVLLWNTGNIGNLSYCSCCKGDKMFPVVCFDLTSREFKCTECFLTNMSSSETYSLPAQVTETIAMIITSAKTFQCHKELSKDGKDACSAKVYCLVCKVIMCMTCFSKHQQKK